MKNYVNVEIECSKRNLEASTQIYKTKTVKNDVVQIYFHGIISYILDVNQIRNISC